MFDPAIAHKVEKARRYAQEGDRATITSLEIDFRGDNDDHHVSLGPDGWACTSCPFFVYHGMCVHVMTMQRMLEGMLPEAARAQAEAAA